MKTIVITLFSFILSTGLTAQCKTPITHKYIIFIDVTDKEHLESLQEFMPIEYKKLLQKLEDAEAFKPCHTVDFHVIPINDLGDNRGINIKFKPISPNLTETQIRKQIVMKFAGELQAAIKNVMIASKTHYNYTRIYEPLCNQLVKRQAHEQVNIIFFSDMLEHNSTSFYSRGRGLNTEKTIAKLSKNCQCSISKDLSLVSIHFISFRSSKNDRNISSAIRFWIEFFKSRNAKTYFGSSLN